MGDSAEFEVESGMSVPSVSIGRDGRILVWGCGGSAARLRPVRVGVARAQAKRPARDPREMPCRAKCEGLAVAARPCGVALHARLDHAAGALALSATSKAQRSTLRHEHIAKMAVRDAFDQPIAIAVAGAKRIAVGVIFGWFAGHG